MCVLHGAIPRWLDGVLLTPAVFSVIGPQHLTPGSAVAWPEPLALMSLVTLLGRRALCCQWLRPRLEII